MEDNAAGRSQSAGKMPAASTASASVEPALPLPFIFPPKTAVSLPPMDPPKIRQTDRRCMLFWDFVMYIEYRNTARNKMS